VLAFDRWRPGTFARTLVLAALTLGAGSTLLWLSHYPRHPTPATYFRQRRQNLHNSNCRQLTGAPLRQTPAVTHAESSVVYAYAGCRPSFVAGRKVAYWAMKHYPKLGAAGLADLDAQMLAPDAPVDAVCPAGRAPGDVDSVCGYALTHATCT